MLRFGLNIGKASWLCRELHRVPTQNQKNWEAESEVAPGSDSKPEKSGRRVGSCTGFRLKTRKTRSQSPKLHRVPTQNQKNQVAESEVAPGSDSKIEKPCRRVRSCSGFRLNNRKTMSQSPKLLRVPTQNQKNQVAESEVTPGSDSKPEKPGCRVRSCSRFRIKKTYASSLSPKIPLATH